MKFIFVDRVGSTSIWSIIETISVKLMAQGHSVAYVIFDDGQRAFSQKIPNGVDLHTIKVPVKKRIWNLIGQYRLFTREFRALLKEIKPDVVHTHFAVPSIAARVAAYREQVPFIVSTQHELYGSMRLHYRWGLRLTERYCSAVTYVSNAVARSFGRAAGNVESALLHRKPEHVVITNGVDLASIRSTIAGAPARVPAKLVCAGRLVPEKGQGILLKALKRVVAHQPGVKLLLIGSGPTEAKLRRDTRRLGLEKIVQFTGWMAQEGVLKEMASSSLILVPSLSVQEGFGLVVAEALVCGTPILASDIPVFHEILDHFPERGSFFAEGNDKDLADKIGLAFTHNPSPQPLPALSREEEARLSSNAMAQSYLDLYSRLTQGSGT